MIGLNYRLDFVRLAGEEKPITGVEDGSTLYEVDTQVLYIFYKGTWYNQTNTESEVLYNSNEVSDIERLKLDVPEIKNDDTDKRSDENEIIS